MMMKLARWRWWDYDACTLTLWSEGRKFLALPWSRCHGRVFVFKSCRGFVARATSTPIDERQGFAEKQNWRGARLAQLSRYSLHSRLAPRARYSPAPRLASP